ncbi:MAG TPA: peptide-methionine (S)-S-oxide reductase, partial [Xanthomarina gelatinilytica]|nr:peptide-methionine (S)-S-oxide reductase [Xanthomarina gelatinilytica]
TFNPNVISFKEILIIFMTTHDPTTLNRQGGDTGTQYRSVIYYHSSTQKEVAEQVLKEGASYYEDKIVTEISQLDVFYEAEDYHQDYYKNNKEQGYCSFVITPKLAKLRKLHANKLK